MNFSDSEIVASILKDDNYSIGQDYKSADIILINTCSIRDNAEQRVRKRLKEFNSLKKKKPRLIIGILGCMAERLKEQLLEEEKAVDLISGPDSYRNLPELLRTAFEGKKAVNVLLSLEETYADISPVRYDSNGINAFISIMRGCENFCSYCVVPGTRGKERSRNPETIIREARELYHSGFRDITLLGQNVNSYSFTENEQLTDFPDLVKAVALVNPLLRVRFATSHPKDLSEKLIDTILAHENICRSIHLPIQSGSSKMLKLMNRKYTREDYMLRIESIKNKILDCSISTDIIAGFCSETEEDHKDTLSLMEWAQYEYAFMFKYSERPGTLAAKKLPDDVPEEIKARRLKEIIDLQQKLSLQSNKKDIGKVFEVLIEGVSKRSKEHLFGRNSQNKVVVFPANGQKPGEYIKIKVTHCTTATLMGEIY